MAPDLQAWKYTVYGRVGSTGSYSPLASGLTGTSKDISLSGYSVGDEVHFKIEAVLEGTCTANSNDEWFFIPQQANSVQDISISAAPNGVTEVYWNPSTSVNDSMRIYINDPPVLIAEVPFVHTNLSPGFTISPGCGQNHFYLQPRSSYGCFGPLQGTLNVTTSAGQAQLQSPANAATVGAVDVPLSWTATCASTYTVVISPNSNLSSPTVNTTVSSPSYNWASAPEGTYYWAIQSHGSGPAASFSATRSFTHHIALVLTAPSGAVSWAPGSTQTVSWVGGGSVSVDMCPNVAEGSPWVTLASGLTSGSTTITVPQWATLFAAVRVRSATETSASGSFAILPSPDRSWTETMLSNHAGEYVQLEESPIEGPIVVDQNANYPYGRVELWRHPLSSWTQEAVADPSFGMISTAIDGSGNLLVAHFNKNANQVRVETRTPSDSWTTDIAASATAGATAVVPGSPSVLYTTAASHYLYFTYKSGSTWTTPAWLDPYTMVGRHLSAGADGSGNIHVAYYDSANADLKYLKRTGTTWSLAARIDSTGNVGTFLSLAVSSSGIPHVSYYDATNGALKYATNTGSGWTSETVDGGAGVNGRYTSIALDGSNQPWISYVGNGILKLAHRSGSTWSTTVVNTSGLATGYTALMLDACHGSPRIAWFDPANYDLYVTLGDADATAPGTVTDLSVQRGRTSAVIRWTAPGDDGSSGQACLVDARYSTTAITAANFDQASRIPMVQSAAPGQQSCTEIQGLTNCLNYYFAVKVRDEAYNWSLMSNVGQGYACGGFIEYSCAGGGGESAQQTVADEDLPRQLEFGTPYPNPASKTMSIRLGIPASISGQSLRLAIYDASGRQVRELVKGQARAGREGIVWDMRSDGGQRVAPGIYFLRMQMGTNLQKRTLTVLP